MAELNNLNNNRVRGSQQQKPQQAVIKQTAAEQLEAELNIPKELKYIIDDSDDDIELGFTEPEELMEIFAHMEEKNLFLIIRCQDGEKQFEEMVIKERQQKADFTREVGILRANEEANNERIKKTRGEKDALGGLTADEEGKSLDPYTAKRLAQEAADLYRTCKVKGENVDTAVEQKIQNSNSLTLIEESENILNRYLEEFNMMEECFPDVFAQTSKKIKTEKRKRNREENARIERELAIQLAEERKAKKDARNVKKVGKPMMQRMSAPAVKKLEVKKKIRTEEEEDCLNYLGVEFSKQ